ncbi:hypothetical protein KFK09_010942 [Dendrobium nobile]|uniref:Transmembrane protein n=1 Tax=Dendrobium nobile TaxID=94219 RepID=A0A8T3BE79_DENNO|nr:hypothetical protein KFK09_010942 [Dendrobium nobile]
MLIRLVLVWRFIFRCMDAFLGVLMCLVYVLPFCNSDKAQLPNYLTLVGLIWPCYGGLLLGLNDGGRRSCRVKFVGNKPREEALIPNRTCEEHSKFRTVSEDQSERATSFFCLVPVLSTARYRAVRCPHKIIFHDGEEGGCQAMASRFFDSMNSREFVDFVNGGHVSSFSLLQRPKIEEQNGGSEGIVLES